MRRDTLIALLGLLAGWAATLWLAPFSDERVNDFFVYTTYADLMHGGALPFRDFGFEYPPLAALPMLVMPSQLWFGAIMLASSLVAQACAARISMVMTNPRLFSFRRFVAGWLLFRLRMVMLDDLGARGFPHPLMLADIF